MGLFKKKLDPISEREKMLNEQMAALEAEIRKLSEPPTAPPAPAPSPPAPAPAPPREPSTPQPRLRSTAVPHGQNVPHSSNTPAAQTSLEPVFEPVDQGRLKDRHENAAPAAEELGTRKSDFPAFWERIRTHFRGPSTSNPKLVSYLAAGSIQGLRPLRYEKRVARNRFIVLAVVLVLVLWGIIAIVIGRK